MEVSSRRNRTEVSSPFAARWSWKAGAIAGFVAAFVMGVPITLADLTVMQDAIAGLYASEGSLVAGWIAHLLHGTLFGLVFAAILSDPGLYRVSEWAWKTLLAGAVFGIVLALAGAGIIMPIWLSVVGFPSPPPVPNVSGTLVVWHLLYGVVLGGVFTVVDGS